MKKMITSFLTAAFLMTAAGAYAQQGDQAAAMKAWQDYMTPGEVHKMLARDNGKWKTETRMWMDPSAEPTKSTGSCTNRMILGGRYQESVHTGTMMGQPFEGRSLVGYDNAKKVFTSTWVDNMGTGIMVMEGTWDKPTNTINFTGKQVDPMTGQEMQLRETFRMVNDNMQVMEMFATMPTGGEMKMMEVTFTRMAPAKKS